MHQTAKQPPGELFQPLALADLAEVLSQTIRHDEENKLATFLCGLSIYTEDSQFNISFNAPAAAGKSHIPLEIAQLFPAEDVMEFGHCSPTSFYHDAGTFDKALGGYVVDLSRKLIIFLDQPHMMLLERLRPMLSHDKKEIVNKITDKDEKHGMRAKTVILKGFPAVIFCSAGLQIDEQESTRFLLLNPQISQAKIRASISQTISREADASKFRKLIEEDPARLILKERIVAIKREDISEVRFLHQRRIEERYFELHRTLKLRHNRDIKRLLSLVKCLALLNLWWRPRDGSVITANDSDVEAAFDLWARLSPSQELNLPPYVFGLYNEVILPAWKFKGGKDGLTRAELQAKHYSVYGQPLDGIKLRQQILPLLETAGLISQESDPNDRRCQLIFPANLQG